MSYFVNQDGKISYTVSGATRMDDVDEITGLPVVVATNGEEIDLSSTNDPNPINGITLSDGDLLVLRNQSTESENGVYEAVTATDPTTWSKYNHPSFLRNSVGEEDTAERSERQANLQFLWDSQNEEFYLPEYIQLTTTATDDSTPEDGIPDITADGSSSATIDIQKYSGKTNALTGSKHDDGLYIETSRGLLSTGSLNLTDGAGSFYITSVKESVIAEIRVYDPNGEILGDTIQIQFAP